jgi:biopolymer transport protein ExbD
MKFEKKRASVKQEIPTASMPDIIFMLLLLIENKRLVSYIWVGKSGKIQIDDSIVQIDNIRTIMYGKAQELPSIIVSLRVDVGGRMGLVTDIQQELRKAFCLRINYSANIKI